MATVLVLAFVISILAPSASTLPAGVAIASLSKNTLSQTSIASSNPQQNTAEGVSLGSPTHTFISGEEILESIEIVLLRGFRPRHLRQRISGDQNVQKRDSPAHFARSIPSSTKISTEAPSTGFATETNPLLSTIPTTTFVSNTNTNTTSLSDSTGTDSPPDRDPGDLTASGGNDDSTTSTIVNPFVNPSILSSLGPLPVLSTFTNLPFFDSSTAINPFESLTTTTTSATEVPLATDVPTGLLTLPPTTAISTLVQQEPAPEAVTDSIAASTSTSGELPPTMTTSCTSMAVSSVAAATNVVTQVTDISTSLPLPPPPPPGPPAPQQSAPEDQPPPSAPPSPPLPAFPVIVTVLPDTSPPPPPPPPVAAAATTQAPGGPLPPQQQPPQQAPPQQEPSQQPPSPTLPTLETVLPNPGPSPPGGPERPTGPTSPPSGRPESPTRPAPLPSGRPGPPGGPVPPAP